MLPTLLCSLAGLLAVPSAAAAAALPEVHAHRGGALEDGRPVTPEDTMPAFENAARYGGTWLELDVVVTRDGVPVVLHDATLDRTTDCSGPVGAVDVDAVERCRVDVVGVSGTLVPAPDDSQVRVPRLAQVLAFAKEQNLGVNVEIKRIPGDPGYTPGDTTFARRVMKVVRDAQLDPAKLIVQSFEPTNLDVAEAELPGVQQSLLTLAQMNEGAPAFAAARDYEWVSPGGVPSPLFVAQARLLGLKVVPYTLNTEAAVKAAAAAGVDAVITDDLPVARRALGITEPPAESTSTSAARTDGARSGATLTVLARSRAQVLRRRGLPVRLTAPRPARATVVALSGRTVVARGTLRLRGAGRRAELVRLTSAGRRVLARRGAVRLSVRSRIDGGPVVRRTVRVG